MTTNKYGVSFWDKNVLGLDSSEDYTEIYTVLKKQIKKINLGGRDGGEKERKGGREGGRERRKEGESARDVFVVPLIYPLINSLVASCMCTDWGLNPQP